ncbi:MAG: hypothetical protein EBU84_05610 [Actinobacteria bacterium]|nr:hypothetical protein [Actinomycetota bacterium]
MASKIEQARQALEECLNLFAWENNQNKESARARITASLGKDIATISGVFLGTSQSLAKLSREKIKSESDALQVDFISAVFAAVSLLAKVKEKPAPEPTPEQAQEEAKPKPRASSSRKTKNAPAPEAGTIGAELSPETRAEVERFLAGLLLNK